MNSNNGADAPTSSHRPTAGQRDVGQISFTSEATPRAAAGADQIGKTGRLGEGAVHEIQGSTACGFAAGVTDAQRSGGPVGGGAEDEGGRRGPCKQRRSPSIDTALESRSVTSSKATRDRKQKARTAKAAIAAGSIAAPVAAAAAPAAAAAAATSTELLEDILKRLGKIESYLFDDVESDGWRCETSDDEEGAPNVQSFSCHKPPVSVEQTEEVPEAQTLTEETETGKPHFEKTAAETEKPQLAAQARALLCAWYIWKDLQKFASDPSGTDEKEAKTVVEEKQRKKRRRFLKDAHSRMILRTMWTGDRIRRDQKEHQQYTANMLTLARNKFRNEFEEFTLSSSTVIAEVFSRIDHKFDLMYSEMSKNNSTSC
jgi:hypothetical protein